jgi:hypothetical protein
LLAQFQKFLGNETIDFVIKLHIKSCVKHLKQRNL